MPKLEQYVAPQKEIRPDNQGYQAFETEGRRIGGIYREIGKDTADAAKANAAILTNKAQWPFTLFALQQKFTPKPNLANNVGFRVLGGVNGTAQDDQFARRVMPNLAAANAADQAAENFANPLSSSLSPQGAHDTTLAAQAAALTVQMRGLIGAGDTTGGFRGPGPGPNADAQASADAWGASLAGQPTGTGIGSNNDTGGDFGGGGEAASAPVEASVPDFEGAVP